MPHPHVPPPAFTIHIESSEDETRYLAHIRAVTAILQPDNTTELNVTAVTVAGDPGLGWRDLDFLLFKVSRALTEVQRISEEQAAAATASFGQNQGPPRATKPPRPDWN